MDDMIFVEKLTAFGLTRQEASIYLCLYKNGTLTGYEADQAHRDFPVQCV